ncbi:hypothetical protein FSARC_368 [Fusarium sarcochroum]|uniref:Heterokaryon incompatibility domain-containing protein n=1 Tax=Fusarium sarcochroum TaxID=1208366 RepID=A0A8H4XFK2_9HYPO|nr:hypothetical protein FSARC_368 [Fusarium sarcochroum]
MARLFSSHGSEPQLLGNDHHPIEHHPNVEKLIESAKDCSFCSVIQKFWSLGYLLERYPDIKPDQFGSLELSLELTKARVLDGDVSCNFLFGHVCAPWHAFTADFKLTIASCFLGNKASRTSLWKGIESPMEEKNEAIKAWFTDCASHHVECSPTIHHYPTRLVEIGANKSDLRLVDTTKDSIEKVGYATLTIGIAWELRIRYLWIDSLCIVQDDLDDWKREAALMKDVYAGSSITISASDATDNTQGCFVDNVPQNQEIQVAQISDASSGDNTLLMRVYQGDFRRYTETSTLSTRGWNLQEQLLSHRVVHCMRPEVHWNCHRSLHTESRISIGEGELRQFSSNFVPNNSTATELQQMWFTKDRLSALAGIVQYYGEKTGFKHLLGCWEETLVTDLLWMRLGDIVDPSMAIPQVPSWSWLSRAEDINLDFWNRVHGKSRDCIVNDPIKIMEVSVTWTGDPMVSDITSANLVIEGPVRQIRLRVDPKGATFHPPYMNVGDEEPDFSKHPIPWRCAGQFDLEQERQDDMFTCLLVRSVTSPVETAAYQLQETFLLLLPVPNSDDMTYQRIGIAMFRGHETEFGSAETKTIRLM